MSEKEDRARAAKLIESFALPILQEAAARRGDVFALALLSTQEQLIAVGEFDGANLLGGIAMSRLENVEAYQSIVSFVEDVARKRAEAVKQKLFDRGSIDSMNPDMMAEVEKRKKGWRP